MKTGKPWGSPVENLFILLPYNRCVAKIVCILARDRLSTDRTLHYWSVASITYFFVLLLYIFFSYCLLLLSNCLFLLFVVIIIFSFFSYYLLLLFSLLLLLFFVVIVISIIFIICCCYVPYTKHFLCQPLKVINYQWVRVFGGGYILIGYYHRLQN